MAMAVNPGLSLVRHMRNMQAVRACRASAHLAVASPPPRSTARPAANVASQAEQSRLSGIVLQYLRHQHRHACLQAPVPIATLPPLSLLAPSALPEVCPAPSCLCRPGVACRPACLLVAGTRPICSAAVT